MSKSSKKIALFTTSQGHYSIAKSIEAYLEAAGHEPVIYFDKHFSMDLYKAIYRYLPQSFKIPYELAKYHRVIDNYHKLNRIRYQSNVQDFIDDEQPDAVISTYFHFNPSLAAIQEELDLPFFNVITDPRTIHPLLIAETAVTNFCFDETAQRNCYFYSTSAAVTPIGWLSHPKFHQDYSQQKVRADLGLDENLMTLLFVSGSDGIRGLYTLVEELTEQKLPVQLVVSCGSNRHLYDAVSALQTKQNSVTVLSFTKDIHLYMQAADLVIGKAGPNMLFESIATKTPFLATNHISGQEDGNLDIITEHQLGWVEERSEHQLGLVLELIKHPQKIEALLPTVTKMAEYNQRAGEKLTSFLTK